MLPYSFAKRYRILSQKENNGEDIHLYCLASVAPTMVAEAIRVLDKTPKLHYVEEEEFEQRLTQTYNISENNHQGVVDEIREELDLDELAHQLPKPQDLLENQDDAPVIKLVNAVLTQAVKNKASDIHIETFEEHITIRYRIDGILREVLKLPRALSAILISRIKVMAKLDIAEKRIPQDGRISLRIAGHTVDVRVSTLPSNHGERIVMRLLDKKVSRLDMTHLGMLPKTLEHAHKLLASANGIILVTGPTGAGKTTSLYAMLNKLNEVTRNILTVEDPIEYDLPGIGQTQVNTKIDMSFAKGLRAILRQDPDVVMIGEIRDVETAEIAVQASLTGHLVLSTLHTNSAIGAITRLRDMGVEPFLLASSLIGLMAQRLIRLLCPTCKLPYTPSGTEKEMLAITENISVFKAKGCEICQFTGYQGRSGIYELIILDETLKQMIHNNESEYALSDYAHTLFNTLKQDGFARVIQGDTSLEEVLRVVSG